MFKGFVSTLQELPQWVWVIFIGALGISGLITSYHASGAVIVAVLAIIFALIVLIFPQVGMTLLVPALFFEADAYSIDLPFGRFRLYHILIILLFARLAFDWAQGNLKWRKTVLDWPLIIYFAVNLAVIAIAPDKLIAFKISGLLILLGMLYWVIVNYVRTKVQFNQMFNFFLASSAGIALFGLFQTFSVWLAQTTDIQLWQGVIIHSDVIPYGRPYSTFVEPDWFGAFMMVALIIAGILFVARSAKDRQVEFGLLTALFGISTILAAVRSSWLGLIIAIVALIVIDKRHTKLLNFSILFPFILAFVAGLAFVIIFSPELLTALTDRLATLFDTAIFSEEPRFIIMRDGWDIWLESIWFGHGPGAYNTLGEIPFVSPMLALIHNIERFQTNALINVLVDTGLMGLAVVGWMGYRFIKHVWRSVKEGTKNTANSDITTKVLALFIASVGLFVSFQASTGVWLGLTWMLVALTISGSLLLIKKPEKQKNHAS